MLRATYYLTADPAKWRYRGRRKRFPRSPRYRNSFYLPGLEIKSQAQKINVFLDDGVLKFDHRTVRLAPTHAKAIRSAGVIVTGRANFDIFIQDAEFALEIGVAL